jgi:ribosome-associated protein
VAADGADVTGDLRVSPGLVIPADELEVSFHTTGGPGGQHANRSATGVALVWNYRTSAALDERQRELLATNLGHRARGGTLRVVADNSRSQWRNRSRARAQLAELVRSGLARPPTRRATKPTRSSRRRRLSNKRHRSETKRLRRRPDVE